LKLDLFVKFNEFLNKPTHFKSVFLIIMISPLNFLTALLIPYLHSLHHTLLIDLPQTIRPKPLITGLGRELAQDSNSFKSIVHLYDSKLSILCTFLKAVHFKLLLTFLEFDNDIPS
jgi:hypothetical protein